MDQYPLHIIASYTTVFTWPPNSIVNLPEFDSQSFLIPIFHLHETG